MKKITLFFALTSCVSLGFTQTPNTWTQKANFGGTERYQAVGFSIGSKGYIGTGLSNEGLEKDFWEYDSATDSWTQKADFAGNPRRGASGFSIGNKGYIGTGLDDWDIYTDFYEYDPTTNSWTEKADFVDFGGFGRAEAVGFSIGSKGYLGTGTAICCVLDDFWEFDPVADTWTAKADFGGIGREEAAGFSIGSKGYIGTGSSPPWSDILYKDFWEFDVSNNTWTQKADFGGFGRAEAVGFSIGSKGYLGTGTAICCVLDDFWEFDPVADTWTAKADFGGIGREEAAGFSIGSKGYIGTGSSPPWSDILYKDFWEFDVSNNTWTQKADFGGKRRAGAVGFSIGSNGYLGTGYSYDGAFHFYKDFWEYDPATNSWTQKADFAGTARGFAVGFSIGSKGYIGIGWDGTNNLSDFWEYTPDGEGSCTIPTSLSIIDITSTTAILSWYDVVGAIGYKVRYKIADTPEWTNIQSKDNNKTLNGLAASTEYAWQVKSICSVYPIVSSEWSEKQKFITGSMRIGDESLTANLISDISQSCQRSNHNSIDACWFITFKHKRV